MPTASAGPPPDAARSQLRTLLAPVVGTAGYDLEDIVVSPAGRRTLVRVIVDADGGVDLDGIASVSRAVALESAIGAYPAYPTTAAASSGPSGTVAAQSATELRSAEQSAATLAAAESAALRGADAALLASISAAESTHAALLT